MSGSYELVDKNESSGQAQTKGVPSNDYHLTVQSFNGHSNAISNVPKHRDGLGRVRLNVVGDDNQAYFLNPDDGKLTPLVVQDSNLLNNKTPAALRLAYWIHQSPVQSGAGDVAAKGRKGGVRTAVKLVPGALALMILLLFPSKLSGEIHYNGRYDPIVYREWLYARSSRNRFENEGGDGEIVESTESSKIQRRPFDEYGMLQSEGGPKYLCFIKDYASSDELPYECMSVNEYMQRNKISHAPDFVFLSYTRKQFCVATDKKLQEWNLSATEFAEKSRMATNDRRTLGKLGCDAAKRAGVKALWLDFECLIPDIAVGETEDDMADVYRICDIVRVCKTMIIVRGPPIADKNQLANPTNKFQWLLEWGSRVWTVPEAILCPAQEIEIYTVGEAQPEIMLKRRLAAAAWDDAASMGHVLEHFEGSLRLTPLELISLILEGLMRRQTDMRSLTSDMSSTGDVSYSLMGLLRRRPLVNKRDSDFEAFARLSLSNDSDKLLERLLCFLPRDQHAPWYEMKDAWDAKLWDVEPHTQVAGIVDNRTVVLDGAFGATIRWGDLEYVASIKRETMWRKVSVLLIRITPVLLLPAILLLAVGGAINGGYGGAPALLGPGGAILAIVVLLGLCTPYLLLAFYKGKFWSTQAYLFGMRGIPDDLGRVEQCLFGIDGGRLKWSATGSPLSRHVNIDGERVGQKPAGAAIKENHDGLELFTVVDTFTMTATAFYAAKPPSVAIVCGREGGMQRALLCSYDWKTQSFCRETVLRMKTLVLQRMSRVDRLRLCLDERGREVR